MARPSNTDERRHQIALGLEQVMAKEGFEGASVAAVARAAGLTPGLVHYHFTNKLAILLEVLESIVGEHHEALERALAAAGDDAMAQLDAFVDHHLSLGAAARPDVLACWIAISAEALRVPKVRRAYEKAVAGLVERLASILRRGVEEGALRCAEPLAAACAVVAAIEGYYVLGATARSVVPRGSAATSVRAMVRGLVEPTRTRRSRR